VREKRRASLGGFRRGTRRLFTEEPPRGGFRFAKLGDVLSRADDLPRLAVRVQDDMALRVENADVTGRGTAHDTVLEVEVPAAIHGVVDGLPHQPCIIGMHSSKDRTWGQSSVVSERVDAVQLPSASA